MGRKCLLYTLALLYFFNTSIGAFEMLIEAKAAYFLPENGKFHKIYDGGSMYGGEVSMGGDYNVYAWASGDSFEKRGHSGGCRHKTKISLIPVAIGLKYLYPLEKWPVDIYLGGGISRTHVKIHDRYDYAHRESTKYAIGGIAKVGALLYHDPYFIDAFINYSYCPIGFHRTEHGKVQRHSRNFGGWTFGVGFGFRIN